ncbi:unnamed protein product [Hermetia illucens]|uniref:Uncharacterized protein n=1 Tax=Hermetia illucens TaxID=343691 RepID=A0A7R8UHQ0_HERIL|nr:unnamed protein product [Hermetia illucens]
MAQFRFVVKELRGKYEPYHDGKLTYSPEEVDPSIATNSEIDYNLSLSPWLCQPYISPAPEEHKKIIEEKVRKAEDSNTIKRQYFDNVKKIFKRKKKYNRIHK